MSLAAAAERLSPKALDVLISEVERGLRQDQLSDYRAYEKQQRFHALGKTHRERLLRAGNQQGKSFAGGREMAFHLTGEYPEDWQGRRFARPILGWASGETAESTRDNAQVQLLGEIGELGSGAIPRRCLGRDYGLATGTASLYDYIRIRHASGGWSTLKFKYYAQGRRKWQGPKVDVVWFDEEPPEDIYDEGLARLIASDGIAYITATLLMGMSEVVTRFLREQSPDRAEVCMTLDDAEHITPERRPAVIASFRKHEREARTMGVPVMGSGRVYPVEEDAIKVSPFQIPDYWPRLIGLDFGWDHPTAAAWLAWDRDADTVYVYDCYRRSEAEVAQHAAAVIAKGQWIPVAWPHDGNNDTAAGPNLARQYRSLGVAMRPENAKFPEQDHDDPNTPESRISVEAGISEILGRMESGRFKVFSHLGDWFDEFRIYHRKDGKLVKKRDDLMSATRIAIMDLRYAKVKPTGRSKLATPRFIDPAAGY